ncbi:MAG TPA: hypothetical protein VGQ26_23655 [Streptosporangiaceae bacterium]|jgi:hypothetical protein|nr:hypothetical protein [Streptosporangiaceae bacterium]
MHPEIARRLGEQHRAELHRQAERRHVAAQLRQPKPARLARLLTAGLLAVRRSPAGRRSGAQPAQPARETALPGVFLDGPEAFGLRTYLTSDEARQLAADWAGLVGRFGDRVDDASRRPAGAVPFEVVVLGRQVPDLAGASGGPAARA